MPESPRDRQSRYSSPHSLNQAITQRATDAARAEAKVRRLAPADVPDYVGRRVNQLRQDVAFRAALRRIFARRGMWVLKGGVALQFRLDPSRPSRDIDLALARDLLGQAQAIEELRTALAVDDESFFSFELAGPSAGLDEHGSVSMPVVALLGNREFSRFAIDLAPPRADVRAETIEVSGVLFGVELVDASFELEVLAIEDQIAEKICAIHEVHGPGRTPSSRWRDLADIAMIATQISGIDGSRVQDVLQSEVDRRAKMLPDGLPESLTVTESQKREWRTSWGRGGREVPIGLDEALEIASQFVQPILGGEVGGKSWDCALRTWV